MSYPEPRRVVITWAESQGLTVLEQARACVLAGVKVEQAQRLMLAYAQGTAEPEQVLAGAMLWYAIAYQLELRIDPSLTWSEAQAWDVKMAASADDAMIAAEARAKVETAIATGLPPDVAGALTMAEVGAYQAIAAERAAAVRPRRRRR